MDYTQMLFEKYGTALLTAKQVSEITGRSVRAMEGDRREGIGISFKRVGGKDNSPVRYPIHEVSKYLNESEKVF